MPIPGNSNIPLVAYWSGDPTNVPLSELNIPQGTIVVDTGSSPAVRQKTSLSDNSTFITLGTGAGGTYSGAILSSSPTAGVGYATGAGGAVTQASSITTGVTLNKVSGQITTVSSTLAAAASAVFTVTNAEVAATDVPVVAVGAYAGAGVPVAFVKNVVAGAFDIVLFNAHASAALNAAVLVNFAIEKAVSA